MESLADFDVAADVGGAPLQLDATRRATVEWAAFDYLTAHYVTRGFECDLVEADKKGLDLKVNGGAVKFLVEVKSCSRGIQTGRVDTLRIFCEGLPSISGSLSTGGRHAQWRSSITVCP